MCDCPSHWVVCFRKDCERAIELNKAAEAAYERTFKKLGYPRNWDDCLAADLVACGESEYGKDYKS